MASVLAIGIATGAIYGLFAVGLVLVYETTRVLNFAQAELGAFGAYLTWTLVVLVGMPWIPAALVAVTGVVILGLAFERLVVRPLIGQPRLVTVVATIAAALLLLGVELQIWTAGPKRLPSPFAGGGVAVAGIVLTPSRLLALGITLVVVIVGGWFLRSTTTGLALRAAAEDPVGVRLAGIRLRHLSALTWGLATGLGAVTGILVALSLGGFSPGFMNRILLLGFGAAVLGGLHSPSGALLGGVLIGVGEAAISRMFLGVPGVVEALVFVVLVMVLLLRPRGLLQEAI
jgi:branched-chain amino acid transport system permease protein